MPASPAAQLVVLRSRARGGGAVIRPLPPECEENDAGAVPEFSDEHVMSEGEVDGPLPARAPSGPTPLGAVGAWQFG